MMKTLFCCLRHACLRIPHFLTLRMENCPLWTKTRPNVRPIFAWRREISPFLLKGYESLLFSNVPMEQWTICDGTEGLCVLLKRFAYPCRYSEMIPIFGRSVSELSIISNEVIDWNYTEHWHRVTQWNHSILDQVLLSTYANAIFDKGAALDNCFGFIDGTVRPICRPVVNQGTLYNEHKRVHSLKFQSVTLPIGLIAPLWPCR